MSEKRLPPEFGGDEKDREDRQRALTRRDFVKIASAAAGAAAVGAGVALPKVLEAAGKKTKVDTPTLSCAGSSAVSINILVCAGATGLPAGFSIQWVAQADYVANGSTWPQCTTDPITGQEVCPPSLCKASFSGNANLSRYNLTAGQCVTVNLGEFLFDEGASTTCSGALVCGTTYVFRAFGHASSALNRSDFTGNLTCSTLDCNVLGGCTLTQGYWKTHGPVGCASGNNANEWPVDTLQLGSVSYTDLELCSILNRPAQGNGLIALAHQLIATKLNIAHGADPTAAAQCIADADALIASLVVPPVGSGNLAASATSGLTNCLTSYNEGATGPGHCD
jgi:hypothetical protein